MKVDQVRTGNNHLFKVPIAPITFLPEETKSGRGVGNLYTGRREGFSYVPVRVCSHEEAVRIHLEVGHPV